MNSLLTVKEVARYLKLNSMTVYRLAREGRIPASKVGGNWRFDKATLDNWLAESARSEGHILVIDDDPGIRTTIEEIISRRGYEIICVDSGEKALAEMERSQFDLVFLDLVLPGINGLKVLEEIRKKDARPVTVIITGHGDSPLAMEAMGLGPQVLIRKPFSVKDIDEVLALVMKKGR